MSQLLPERSISYAALVKESSDGRFSSGPTLVIKLVQLNSASLKQHQLSCYLDASLRLCECSPIRDLALSAMSVHPQAACLLATAPCSPHPRLALIRLG